VNVKNEVVNKSDNIQPFLRVGKQIKRCFWHDTDK